MDNSLIPSSATVTSEALELAADIMADIELSRVSVSTAALKTTRLARLLNDFDSQKMFQYEVSGYPSGPKGIPQKAWRLAEVANRVYQEKDTLTDELVSRAYTTSIEGLESAVESCKMAMQAAADPAVSLSSANMNQRVYPPKGNQIERTALRRQMTEASGKLASRRTLVYEYAAHRYYELKFSGVAQDVFSEVRDAVDREIGNVVPSAVQKFSAVHENLRSANPEDWSNAVHSCRRILQDLADAVFPPQSTSRKSSSGNEIKLGKDAYINRLACFVEDQSHSKRFEAIVGSHLDFLGNRLDAVFRAAQKGSHAKVVRNEANRYVVYTYMIVGDILSLRNKADTASVDDVVEVKTTIASAETSRATATGDGDQ